MAQVYDAGRGMPDESVAEWRSALGPWLAGIPVADVGSRTGIWASFIANWFNLEVVEIEPSQAMRQRAVADRSRPRVSYVAGNAEHLPLSDNFCGALWMSPWFTTSRTSRARQAKQGAYRATAVLIRNPFAGRRDDILWTRVFPSALRLAEKRHPRVESVVEAFLGAGFQQQELRRVTEIAASDLHEYANKITTRADSTLILISDEDFDRGLAELRRMADQAPWQPVTMTLDLLVLH